MMPSSTAVDSDTTQPLPVAAVAALHKGNKIEAIKIVRSERSIDLKRAKDVVEEYLRSQPALQASLAAKRAEALRGALRWLFIVVALAALVYFSFSPK